MKYMAKNFITILSLLVTIIVSITAYAYKSDLKGLGKKIDTEITDRKEACESINKTLDKKVNKDAFEEFKDGQDKILENIKESNKRERVYQDIIKELTFMVDTSSIIYDFKLTNN